MTNNTQDYNDNLYFEKLQKSKNVANNVANENSQDLTEQWKKGELPPRYYYIKDNKNKIEIDEYVQWYKERGQKSWKSFVYYKVMEVLAPVPTFDEWKASYSRTLENKVQKLEQQLAIAVEALEKIKKMTSPPCYIPDFEQQYIWASLSLQQIEELKQDEQKSRRYIL